MVFNCICLYMYVSKEIHTLVRYMYMYIVSQ